MEKLEQQKQTIFVPKKELLSCRLCTDIFKRPTTLSCGHTFCYFCLYKFMKQHKDLNSHFPELKEKKISSRLEKQEERRQLNLKTKQLTNESIKKQDTEVHTVVTSQTKIEVSDLSDDIPIPLCPLCCSLIFKPIKEFKENLSLANLISKSGYRPDLNFDEEKYDENVVNFDHHILIEIEKPSELPLPYCSTKITFKTCFLDDILEQSHHSFVVIQWENFTKDIALRGKILRYEMFHHSAHKGKESAYQALFLGISFVKLTKKKELEINLSSRHYTEAAFYQNNQQLSNLFICKWQPYQSVNPQPIEAFSPFLKLYDGLSNPHYMQQVSRIIDPNILYQRNNPEAMIYCCIKFLRIPDSEKQALIVSFDDKHRLQKINEYLSKMQGFPIDQVFQITVPGNYNSGFVFGVIFFLILLHFIQNS